MQQMVNKSEALAIEAAPLQIELINENQEKLFYLIEKKLVEIDKQVPKHITDA